MHIQICIEKFLIVWALVPARSDGGDDSSLFDLVRFGIHHQPWFPKAKSHLRGPVHSIKVRTPDKAELPLSVLQSMDKVKCLFTYWNMILHCFYMIFI